MENSFRENENHSTLPLKKPINHAYLIFIQDSFYTHQSDILPQYKKLQDLLLNINTTPSKSNPREDFEDSCTENYFYEVFLKEIVKQIISVDMTCSAQDLINSCLKQIIRIWAHHLVLNSNMTSKLAMNSGINHKPIVDSLSNLVIYAMKKEILSFGDIQYIWENLGIKPMIQGAIYEGLTQSNNNSIKNGFLKEIILHLSEISSIQISELDYLFISSLFDLCQPDQFLLQQYIEFSWKMLSDHAKDRGLSSSLFRNISFLITKEKLAQETKLQLFEKFIKTVNNKDMTLFTIRIIKKLLDSYPKESENQNELTFSACLSFLCKEKGLLAQVIAELKSLLKLSPQEYTEQEVSERVQFIDFLITSISKYSRIMSYELLTKLWNSAILCMNYQYLSKRIFSLIKEVIDAPDLVRCEELLRLFREKLNPYKDSEVLELLLDEFECLKSLFVIANEYLNNISDVVLLRRSDKDFLSRFERLKIRDKSGFEENGDFQFQVDVMPIKLEGYATLWKLAQLPKNEDIARKARNLLVYLHTSISPDLHFQIKDIREEYLRTCFECLIKLRSEETLKNQILRCLDLIHAIIDITEKQDNSECPDLHFELEQGELITLNLKDEYADLDDQVQTIKIKSDALVCELFKPEDSTDVYLEEQVSSSKIGIIITPQQKNRTISSLGLKDNATLLRKTRSLPKAYLIQYDNNLNPKAREIFTEWFKTYSDNGKMDVQQYAAFPRSGGNDEYQPNGRRAKTVFCKFDEDHDGYLTLDDFLKLHLHECKERPRQIWNDLFAHKKNNRLANQKQVTEQKNIDPPLHISLLISSNKNYVQQLFTLLESEDEIASKAFELLNRLPTDSQIFSDIVLLNGARYALDSRKPDWNFILDPKNIYKLFYSFSIMEYLSNNKRLGKVGETHLLEYNGTWLSDFHAFGGFEHLNVVLNYLLSLKSTPVLERNIERIRSLMKNIIF